MAQDIFITVGAGEVRVAAVEEGRLQALSCTRLLGVEASGSSLIGDIVLGRVVRVMEAVQAAFVEIGQERAGFLGAREARALAPEAEGEPAIGQLVREGDKVLVQIVKDPIGEKGARLTASITIPGRLSVLTPLQQGIGLSRRIEDEAERDRLAAIGAQLVAEGVLEGGCILRTAAVGATAGELREDLQQLKEDWAEVAALCKYAKVPETLRRDLGPVERALRDSVHGNTGRILIDDARTAERARAYCSAAIPGMAERIEVFCGPGGLFDDLEADIEGLLSPRVPLACGGWLTVEGTEALTAIDVNSGSFARSNAIEDTGLAVNLEAAAEIGRQIRLRGIGGLIVIDFIHMHEPEHAGRVLDVLAGSLARDGVPVNIGPVTPFGLVEVTRKRVREPLLARWSEDCAACRGSGMLRKPEAVAMEVLRRVEASARAAPGKAVEAHAAPEVIAWLEAEGAREALARRGVARLALVAEPSFPRERIEISTAAS
jgi:ribonuclease G